jgi:hypothetical protein
MWYSRVVPDRGQPTTKTGALLREVAWPDVPIPVSFAEATGEPVKFSSMAYEKRRAEVPDPGRKSPLEINSDYDVKQIFQWHVVYVKKIRVTGDICKPGSIRSRKCKFQGDSREGGAIDIPSSCASLTFVFFRINTIVINTIVMTERHGVK